ncbi:MAG TPA: CBS domain-containing protein [Casimicrobiaceae bacterium]|nr:CBS domain-containing protein [Casimicrobiaceae bacterium]
MSIRSLRSIVAEQKAPLVLPASTTVTEAAKKMRENSVGAAMVVEGTRLAGIFTERDALFRVLAHSRDPASTPVAEVMTRNPQTIHPDKPFDEALRMMHEGHFRNVPVVEDGRPLGMVSVRDALDRDLLELREALETRELVRD